MFAHLGRCASKAETAGGVHLFFHQQDTPKRECSHTKPPGHIFVLVHVSLGNDMQAWVGHRNVVGPSTPLPDESWCPTQKCMMPLPKCLASPRPVHPTHPKEDVFARASPDQAHTTHPFIYVGRYPPPPPPRHLPTQESQAWPLPRERRRHPRKARRAMLSASRLLQYQPTLHVPPPRPRQPRKCRPRRTCPSPGYASRYVCFRGGRGVWCEGTIVQTHSHSTLP